MHPILFINILLASKMFQVTAAQIDRHIGICVTKLTQHTNACIQFSIRITQMDLISIQKTNRNLSIFKFSWEWFCAMTFSNGRIQQMSFNQMKVIKPFHHNQYMTKIEFFGIIKRIRKSSPIKPNVELELKPKTNWLPSIGRRARFVYGHSWV